MLSRAERLLAGFQARLRPARYGQTVPYPMPSRESNVVEPSKGRRVLVVDDQEDSAELMAMLLTNYGHEVAVAHDGESALVLALEFRPQLAILDLSLPVMDGYRLAGLLRANPVTASCRLLALSGYCGEADRIKSKRAGFEQHLAKPLGLDALLTAILADAGTAHVERA